MENSKNRERVVLVTGISSGIGQATASMLSARGFRVFGTMRRFIETNTVVRDVQLVQLDVCSEESVRGCLRTVLERAGRLDALVNNAGYTLVGALEETSIEEAKALFETNFFGALRTSQAVLPIMREQGYGRIANIGSVVGFLPAPYQGIYAASKHALEGYSESLDHEVRQFGIRVSVVEPGFTRTNIAQNGRLPSHPLSAYDNDRNLVMAALEEGIAKGEDPVRIASLVLEAVTSTSPRLRYPAGREAKFLNLLRKFAPSRLFDKGLRKQFRLDSA
jgi:NAD(P)-dependent dehydrogenase (short-subunit alcohol dehydrogenase family)